MHEDRLRRELADAHMNRANWDESEALDKIQARTSGGSEKGCPLTLLLLPLLLVRALVVMAATKSKPAKPPRLCRTREECWQAGWEDGANDPPMTERQIAKLAPLWRLYVDRPDDPAACEAAS
jgi:hypothetical protein